MSSRAGRNPDYERTRYLLSAWLPVALGIGVIMVESTEMFGSNHTSGPLRMLWESIFGSVSNARWAILHHYIRKSGHFFWYGFIGLGVAARLVDDSAALPLHPGCLSRHSRHCGRGQPG